MGLGKVMIFGFVAVYPKLYCRIDGTMVVISCNISSSNCSLTCTLSIGTGMGDLECAFFALLCMCFSDPTTRICNRGELC